MPPEIKDLMSVGKSLEWLMIGVIITTIVFVLNSAIKRCLSRPAVQAWIEKILRQRREDDPPSF